MINYSRTLMTATISEPPCICHDITYPISTANQTLTVDVNPSYEVATLNNNNVMTLCYPTININITPHFKYEPGTIVLNGVDTGVTSISEYFVTSDLVIGTTEATVIPDNVLGVEYVKATHTWHRIDSNAADVADASSSVLDALPVFAGITSTTIDSCAMVRIPKFYFLYQNTGTAHRWWIDTEEFTIDGIGTAKVHPAFIVGGNEIDQFYIGAYEASTDSNNSTKITSKYNVATLGNLTIDEFRTKALARNVNGVTGFDITNIYQFAAIQMLMLVDLGTSDTLTTIGSGRYTGGKVNTGKSNAVWRGIHELWGNMYEFVTGIEQKNGIYCLYDDVEDAYVVTGVSAGVSEGLYALDISSTLAGDYGLFLPVTVSSDTSESIFMFNKQYLRNSAESVFTVGGAYTTGSTVGPFTISFETSGSAYKHAKQGARLTKV